MHPFLVHRRWLVLYLLLFLQAGIVLAELLAGPQRDLRGNLWLLVLPLFMIHAFSCLASWYLCRALPLGKVRLERVVATQAGSAILASATLVGIGVGWARFLGPQIASLYRGNLVLVLVFAVFLYSLMVVLHYLFSALEASRRAEADALGLQVLAREAELQFLRTQLDPHFLFNSLNSVSALVTTDPKQARFMCGRLAQFFRRILDLGSQRTVSLSAELDLVQDYLAIEQVRFGDRLSHELLIDKDAEAYRLPPLILQPLVENAVRHGVGHLLDGGTVSLEVTRDAGWLSLRVRNPCDPDRPASRGAGVGLENVNRRLQAVYGGDAKMAVRDRQDRFEIEIRLPLEPEQTVSHRLV